MTFHDLYEQHAPDVYRFAFWLSGSAANADDITAETFVRAWASNQKIRTETVNQLQQLSETDRAAFILRIQYELPYAEIARILAILEAAAKVKVHRCNRNYSWRWP